jgi:hypothetical protein
VCVCNQPALELANRGPNNARHPKVLGSGLEALAPSSFVIRVNDDDN